MTRGLVAAFSLAVVGWVTTVGQADAGESKSLQDMIDEAEPNSVVKPPPGIYSGSVIIEKPITLDGAGQVTIDAGGKGSVIFLDTDGASVRNLRLTNSGDSHNDLDSGVQVRGNFNSIKDNTIDNCLFGIDLQQSEYNVIRRNRISSKPLPLGVRGDSIRLWYSFNNRILDNTISDVRDTVVWYSHDNEIVGNSISGGRYGLHFMYSKINLVESNRFEDNSVGVFLMYSDSVKLRNNTMARSVGASGMGIGSKESSDLEITNNRIVGNATGLYLDVSPYQPGTTNRIKDNLVAYNGVGISFHNDWTGSEIEGNRFRGNLTQATVRGGGSAARNQWLGNHWDDYEGFDLDHDGVGDTPYELHAFADRIWMDVPAARFFLGSPVLGILDFLERLAPFSPPRLLLRDKSPQLADPSGDVRQTLN